MQIYNIEGLPAIRAGVGVADFTPEPGLSMCGYFHDRFGVTVRDRLCAHALVLQGDGEQLVIISSDLLMITNKMSAAFKAAIQAELNIAPDHVMIHATHTHTAPVPCQSEFLKYSQEFIDSLPKFFVQAVRTALESMFDAVIVPGRETVRDVGSNRLTRMPDGTERFAKGVGLGLAGPVDRELQALRICDKEGETRAFVVNFAMHPDTIGGGTATFYSADWPGEIRKTLKQVYGDHVVTLFLNGCCGDLNTNLDHPMRRLPRIPRAVSIGRTLAGATMTATEQADPMESNRTNVLYDVLDIPYYTRDEAFRKLVEANRAENANYLDSALVLKDKYWTHDGEIAHVPVQVMRCGDICFVALPGEIFTRWGLELKHWSPAPFTFIVEQANGWFGYIPTTDQALRGAYGALPVLSRQLVDGGGRILADRAQVMLCDIWK